MAQHKTTHPPTKKTCQVVATLKPRKGREAEDEKTPVKFLFMTSHFESLSDPVHAKERCVRACVGCVGVWVCVDIYCLVWSWDLATRCHRVPIGRPTNVPRNNDQKHF